MARLLYIKASPRGDESYSIRAGREFVAAFKEAHAGAEVDTLDVFADEVHDFRAPAAGAKYAVMGGGEPQGDAQRAWKQVIDAVERFKAADVVAISSAMWNFSIPWRLKQYIDVIVQPGLTFSFLPDEGYSGLVTGRSAVLLLARGGAYTGEMAGLDYQKTYLESILRFIGFEEIHNVIIEPTLHGGPQTAEQSLEAARDKARNIARSIEM